MVRICQHLCYFTCIALVPLLSAAQSKPDLIDICLGLADDGQGRLFGEYPSWEETTTILDSLVHAAPEHIQLLKAGVSYEGRPINAYWVGHDLETCKCSVQMKLNKKIQNEEGGDVFEALFKNGDCGTTGEESDNLLPTNLSSMEPTMLITSLHHAREPTSLTVSLFFVCQYLASLTAWQAKSSNSNLLIPPETAALWFRSRNLIYVPFVNPDGYKAIELTGNKNIRKNRRPTCHSNATGSISRSANVNKQMGKNQKKAWSNFNSVTVSGMQQRLRNLSTLSRVRELSSLSRVRKPSSSARIRKLSPLSRIRKSWNQMIEKVVGSTTPVTGLRGKGGNSPSLFVDDGVDLNRNYDSNFLQTNGPCHPEEYQGAEPFSEPETKSIRRLAEAFNFSMVLNFHSFGDVWTHPYNCCAKKKLPGDVDAIFREIGQVLHVKQFGSAPSIPILGYETSGEADDWFLEKHGVISMSPEVGPEAGGFFPDLKTVKEVNRETLTQIGNMMAKVGDEISVTITNGGGTSSESCQRLLATGQPQNHWTLVLANTGLRDRLLSTIASSHSASIEISLGQLDRETDQSLAPSTAGTTRDDAVTRQFSGPHFVAGDDSSLNVKLKPIVDRSMRPNGFGDIEFVNGSGSRHLALRLDEALKGRSLKIFNLTFADSSMTFPPNTVLRICYSVFADGCYCGVVPLPALSAAQGLPGDPFCSIASRPLSQVYVNEGVCRDSDFDDYAAIGGSPSGNNSEKIDWLLLKLKTDAERLRSEKSDRESSAASLGLLGGVAVITAVVGVWYNNWISRDARAADGLSSSSSRLIHWRRSSDDSSTTNHHQMTNL